MSQLISYTYNDQVIAFDVTTDSVMVNATEMGKIFDKEPEPFMRNKGTQAFIKECLKTENSRFLGVEKEEDLYISKQKSGTWMHRVLALKYAAWLDPTFELWVWLTIDQILFGQYYELKEQLEASARRKQRIELLEAELSENDKFKELEQLKTEERRSAYRRGKVIKNQLQLFQNRM